MAGMVVHPAASSSSSTSGNRSRSSTDDAGEEAVGLVHLRGAAPLGGERLLGVGGGAAAGRARARSPVAGPAERQRGAQPADPSADDHDALACHRLRATLLPLAIVRRPSDLATAVARP